MSHRLPARLDGHTSARLQAMLATLCRGLEIVGGPVNFDFVVDHAGTVYFVEVGARSGGEQCEQEDQISHSRLSPAQPRPFREF